MNWTKEQYAEYQNRRSPSSAEPQQAVCDEPMATTPREAGDSGCIVVRIKSYRKRLLDADNLAGAKYLLDSTRYAGLIPDDSPEKITLILEQEKSNDERTEIEFITP